jgi:putative transposase
LPSKKQDIPRLKDIHSQVLQDVPRRLDKAFQSFFRRLKTGEQPGYPKFRSARRYDSFTYPQSGFSIKDGKMHLSKIGHIKIILHRPIEGEIKTLTIRRQAGMWFACFSCEVEVTPLPKTGQVAGIDLGITNLAITNNGEFLPPSKNLRKSEKRLKRLQRAVSRKKKGSHRRKKAIRQLQKLHWRIANQRRDQAFKAAYFLLHHYDALAMEDLQPQNMLKNHHLAKSIADAAWDILANILEFKADEWGRKIVFVDPKYTSQICSRCGAIVKKKLSERQHNCSCGFSIHRDINAAINILKRSGLVKPIGDSTAVAV